MINILKWNIRAAPRSKYLSQLKLFSDPTFFSVIGWRFLHVLRIRETSKRFVPNFQSSMISDTSAFRNSQKIEMLVTIFLGTDWSRRNRSGLDDRWVLVIRDLTAG